MMCLSANVFAEDDGYGNDIPAARSEGTVDDGYGNKMPASSQVEYKSFEEARSSRGNGQLPKVNVGGHLAIGFGSYISYPSSEVFKEYYGKNDWTIIYLDLGGVLKYRINNLLSFVPELDFGFYISQREIGSGSDWFWGDYKVNETRVLFDLNVPLVFRVTPVPFIYLEGGARLNFNLATSHSRDYYDKDGNALQYYNWGSGEFENVSEDLEKWEVKFFVPSAIAGLGATFKLNKHEMDVGLRFNWDLTGIEKKEKLGFVIDSDDDLLIDQNGNKVRRLKVIENKTRSFTVQLIMNYYLF
jgi:hypothetical protein